MDSPLLSVLNQKKQAVPPENFNKNLNHNVAHVAQACGWPQRSARAIDLARRGRRSRRPRRGAELKPWSSKIPPVVSSPRCQLFAFVAVVFRLFLPEKYQLEKEETKTGIWSN